MKDLTKGNITKLLFQFLSDLKRIRSVIPLSAQFMK